MDLPKRYDPSEAEPRLQGFWQEKRIYAFNEGGEGEVFSVDTPPPTVSGRMHLGHSFSYAQQDYCVRFQRMRGKRVLYPFGTDDNGLPTERLVEKKRGVRAGEMKREGFRKLCLSFVKEELPAFTADWIRLGMSCDFSRPYSTIDEHSQRVGQHSFIDLYKKGLIYRRETPVAWCPTCQTAIAQAEFENVELTSHFNDVIFRCSGKELVISTTRPELIPACVALFAHPDDPRYRELRGKFAIVPLFNYDVPILFDESVDREKGTGLMMVCTFGDKEDIDKWYRYKLPLRIILTRDGRLNEQAPGYEGLPIKEARAKIITELREQGLLVRQEKITHAVNVHERCSTEIEFLKTKQWFINVLDKKEELLEAADRIRWFPEHMKSRYRHWVENLNWDWCISRQRSYGVPIPVWYTSEGEVVLPSEEELPVDPTGQRPKGREDEELTPETDVFDTWMISSVTPQIVLDWKGGEERMNLYPMSLRPQAHDIIRTWAFYTIVKGVYHHGKPPWKDIVISGHVLDPKGEKMSKSKGNVIHPQDVIAKYSADALRFWAASVKLGDDLPYMEKDVRTGQRTITKLWNATRFAITHLGDYQGFEGELALLDRWLLSRFTRILKECTDHFERYEYSKTKFEAEQFFWNTFCDNYLELVKDRLYAPEKYGEQTLSAKHTLYSVTLGILKLFAPIMPHVTEELYQLYFKKIDGAESVHVSKWPEYREELIDEEAEAVGDEVVRILQAVRKFKSERNLSLKAPLKKVVVRTELDLRLVEQELLAATRAETLESKKGGFDITITA